MTEIAARDLAEALRALLNEIEDNRASIVEKHAAYDCAVILLREWDFRK